MNLITQPSWKRIVHNAHPVVNVAHVAVECRVTMLFDGYIKQITTIDDLICF